MRVREIENDDINTGRNFDRNLSIKIGNKPYCLCYFWFYSSKKTWTNNLEVLFLFLFFWDEVKSAVEVCPLIPILRILLYSNIPPYTVSTVLDPGCLHHTWACLLQALSLWHLCPTPSRHPGLQPCAGIRLTDFTDIKVFSAWRGSKDWSHRSKNWSHRSENWSHRSKNWSPREKVWASVS